MKRSTLKDASLVAGVDELAAALGKTNGVHVLNGDKLATDATATPTETPKKKEAKPSRSLQQRQLPRHR